MMEKHNVVGNCPKCGAPIYAKVVENWDDMDEFLDNKYTCDCFLSYSGRGVYSQHVNPNFVQYDN